MTVRNVIRGCVIAAGAIATVLVLREAASYAATQPQLNVIRPVAPAAPNDNAQPEVNLNQPNIPPASSIPGTEAYELAQLRMRVDALAAAVNGIRQQMAQDKRELGLALAALQRPVCSADDEVHDPVSGATETCSPYMCNQAEGACRTSCRRTTDCSLGYVCDVTRANGVCIRVN